MKLIEINETYVNEDAITKLEKNPIVNSDKYRYLVVLNDGSKIEVSSTDYESLVSDYSGS